jgi:uncharacterized membrane-anchored protein YjiN (DUF445 family)
MKNLPESTQAAHTDPAWRMAQIRRMQMVATGLLVVMAIIFAVAAHFEGRWVVAGYIRAFAEAAMIGGCADWFAVVALFRHPFGVPIPHTAIVPRNKERIGQSLGAFVCNNFLAADVVTARLDSLDLAGRSARWISEDDNARQAARWAIRLARPVAEAMDDSELRAFAGSQMKKAIEGVAMTPLLARAGRLLRERGYHLMVFDAAVSALETFLAHHEGEIRQEVEAHSSHWVPRWVDNRMAQVLITALMETVGGLRDPDHPWREEFETSLDRLIDESQTDPALIANGEKFKNEFLADPAVIAYFERIWQEARASLAGPGHGDDGIACQGLTTLFAALGRRFVDDRRMQVAVNRWILRIVERQAIPQRDAIGAFIAGVVGRWESQTLVDKLELQVGSDLQYIRMNGTLVGGLVGLVLFAVLRALA